MARTNHQKNYNYPAFLSFNTKSTQLPYNILQILQFLSSTIIFIGDTGAKGDAGVSGPRGSPGSVGAEGPRGKRGMRGPIGIFFLLFPQCTSTVMNISLVFFRFARYLYFNSVHTMKKT